MNTVTLFIASREDVTRRALAAFDGKAQGARITPLPRMTSFGSP